MWPSSMGGVTYVIKNKNLNPSNSKMKVRNVILALSWTKPTNLVPSDISSYMAHQYANLINSLHAGSLNKGLCVLNSARGKPIK